MAKLSRLGDLLVESGTITRDQLGEALRHQHRVGGRLGATLVELGLVDDRTLAGALAKQLSIPSVSQAQLEKIPREVVGMIPGPLAARLRTIPLRVDGGRLWVAMSDPSDKDAIDELSRLRKLPVRPMVAPDHLIQMALEIHYNVAPSARPQSRPVDGMAVAAPIEITIDDEVPLDDSDVATGFLDDEGSLPPAPIIAPRFSFKDLMEQLVRADHDNTVLDLVLRYLSPAAPKQCAFILANGELSGWRGLQVDMARLMAARAALDDLPLFRQALDSGKSVVGPLDPSMLGRLAEPLGFSRAAPGVLLPLRVGRQPVGVLVALSAPTLVERRPELDKLVGRIDNALHILHLKRMLLAP